MKRKIKRKEYRALAVRFVSLRRYVRALEALGMCVSAAYARFGKWHLNDCDMLADIRAENEGSEIVALRPCSCGIEEVELKVIELQTTYNRRIADGRAAFKVRSRR